VERLLAGGDDAARHVLDVEKDLAAQYADRALVKPTGGRQAPHEMTEDEYVRELSVVEEQVADIQPIRRDPDFGDEYAPEDEETLRRWNELVPPGLDDANNLSSQELYRAHQRLARDAGL
jgi:hypothetical protein